MATYAELYNLLDNSELQNRVAVGVGVAAEMIGNEDPATENHANRLLWAARAYSQPRQVAREMLWSVVIANRAYTIEQILAADDAAVQANVDAVVDLFATG